MFAPQAPKQKVDIVSVANHGPKLSRTAPFTATMIAGAGTSCAWDFGAMSLFPPEGIGGGRPPSPLPSPKLARPILSRLDGGDLNDPLEHEADRVADDIMSMDGPGIVARSARSPLIADKGATKAEESGPKPAETAALRSPGESMDASTRAYFEPRFGHDFSRVRVHVGAAAERSALDVNAQAYTVGSEIVFGAGRFAPGTLEGRRLLAHELTHVVQQSGIHRTSANKNKGNPTVLSSAGPHLQRKLLVTTDSDPKRIREMFDLLEPTSRLTLAYDRKSKEVSIIASRALTSPVPSPASGPNTALPSLARGTPSSPTLAVRLGEIIEDPQQDAELRLGGPQPGVSFGEFPTSGPLIQVIDIDDLVRLDAGAPGSGVATLFHEIVENYRAHAPDQPGLFPSHEAGLEAEAQVASELVAPGERVAEALVAKDKGIVRWVRDYERYFLVYDRGPPDNTVLNAWQASRVNVGTFTIDGFGRGSEAIPTGAQTEIEAVANAMRLNPAATVRIDCGGDDRHLALRRAQQLQDAILDNGKNRNLYGFDLRGERNFNLVATGLADERAAIVVDQPDTEVASRRGSIVKRVLGGSSRPQPPKAGIPDWRPRR
jgi:hypothetical protein